MNCLTLLSNDKSKADSSGVKSLYSRISSASEIYPYAREGVSLFLVDKSALEQESLQHIRHVIDTLYYKPLLVYDLSDDEERNEELEALVDGICVASEGSPAVSDRFLSIVKVNSPSSSNTNVYNTVENTITIALPDGKEERIVISECKITPSFKEDSAFESGSLDSSSTKVLPIAKICGLKTAEAAQVAIDHGATMLGMIMVPGRSRTVGEAEGLAISQLVRQVREQRKQQEEDNNVQNLAKAGDSHFYVNSLKSRKVKGQQHSPGPFLVGVFRNQPLSQVLELQKKYQLDYVQLHGDEPLSWCESIPVPVIKRFTPGTEQFPECLKSGLHVISLIDSPLGGEGKLVDRSTLKKYAQLGARFVIAGGLTPDNVKEVYDNGCEELQGMIGVDVSGGVESSEGVKDYDKIKRFLESIISSK